MVFVYKLTLGFSLKTKGFNVFALNFRVFLPLPFANLIENFLGIGLTAWHEIVKLIKVTVIFPVLLYLIVPSKPAGEHEKN
ncbi:hypothetical protein [Carboxydothermus pertinax]|uniref:hypothetical protein n=1 Tax=Carboxydothermus pertinax TaxID=870242 RepID=UPI00190EB0CC|nr:hypothetical protein [Carboxydothermus pertinax]